MRVRVEGDIGQGYRFEVRIFGFWFTIAEATRYEVSRSDSVDAALLDRLYRLGGGGPRYRVALVRRGSETDLALRADATKEMATRLSDMMVESIRGKS